MSENLRKLVGVAVMAAIVVVGVVMTNDDDTDFTRNLAFGSGGTDKGAGVPLDTGGTAEEQFEDLLDRNLKFLSAQTYKKLSPLTSIVGLRWGKMTMNVTITTRSSAITSPVMARSACGWNRETEMVTPTY